MNICLDKHWVDGEVFFGMKKSSSCRLHISTKIIVSSSLQKQELESSPSFGPSEKSIRIKHNMLERRGQAKSIYIKGLGKDKVVQRNRVMLPCICLGGRAERFWPGLCDQYFGGIYVDF
ncbi:hypothetical protein OWV82_018167 [Melia azedarach]|uniref:Uncharacterized protein n=1 Tax=Melia azedarach TaxID=155640 RepID=A0ACC1XAH8_MELAZ|nr:hypothetical protein OWV82_018167 [Melia azedarach]